MGSSGKYSWPRNQLTLHKPGVKKPFLFCHSFTHIPKLSENTIPMTQVLQASTHIEMPKLIYIHKKLPFPTVSVLPFTFWYNFVNYCFCVNAISSNAIHTHCFDSRKSACFPLFCTHETLWWMRKMFQIHNFVFKSLVMTGSHNWHWHSTL